MVEIKKGLHKIDQGSPHIHFTRPHPAQVPDCKSDSDSQLDSKDHLKESYSQRSDKESNLGESACGDSGSDTDESGSDERRLSCHK